PRPKHSLHKLGLQHGKYRIDPIMRRDPVRQIQILRKPCSPRLAKGSHPNKIIHPTQGRNHADEKNIDQRMFHFPLPRIRY
ncbi:MAG: hypothetical protein NT142_13780, partial [Planctomycetota bacterium]|nr:hypothetical protein [Planctomycetota bacterium]